MLDTNTATPARALRNIPNSRRVEKCYDFASCKTWQPRSRALKLRRCPSDIFRRASSYLFSFSVRSGLSSAGSSAANGQSTRNTITGGSSPFLLSIFSGSAGRTGRGRTSEVRHGESVLWRIRGSPRRIRPLADQKFATANPSFGGSEVGG